MKIVISTEVETWIDRERNPDDEWDIGDEGGCIVNVTAREARDYEQAIGYWGESALVELDVQPGQSIFAVVADYTSGCTFGRTAGHSQVLDAFTSSEQAEQLKAAAQQSNGYSFTFGDKEYRPDWYGYFEHLQSLDVWELTLANFSGYRLL